jgi:hypothetical protein
MSRQQWKDIFEGVGFIAIVSSLIFVGLETQNSSEQTALNTRSLEIAAYQELMNNIAEINVMNIQSAGAAEITAPIYGIADVKTWRTNSALFLTFRHGDIAFFMYERGAIDTDRLRSALRILPLETEQGREFWNQQKFIFVEPYQIHVDRLLEEGFWGVVGETRRN